MFSSLKLWFRGGPITIEQFDAEASIVDEMLSQHQYAEAEKLSRRLLDTAKKKNGVESRLVAEVHFVRSRVFLHVQDNGKSLAHLRSAASFSPATDDDQKQKLTFEMNLGDMLRHTGNLDEARTVLTLSLAARKEFYGVDHAGYGYGAEALGTVCLELGLFEEAQRLAIEGAHSFKDHDRKRYFSALTLSLLANKGMSPKETVLTTIEKLDDYDALLAELANGGTLIIAPWVHLLIEVAECFSKSGHTELEKTTLISLTNLSVALRMHSERIQALKRLSQLAVDDPTDHAFFLQGLALAFDEAGDKQKAMQTYEDAFIASENGSLAVQVQARRNFAVFLAHNANEKRAESMLKDALGVIKSEASEEHGRVSEEYGQVSEEHGRVRVAYGILLHHQQRYTDAVEQLQESLPLLPATHPDALMSRSHLGDAAQNRDCDCALGMKAAHAVAIRSVVEKHVPADLIREVRIPESGSNEKIAIYLTRKPSKDESALIEIATAEAMKIMATQLEANYGPQQ